MRCNAPDVLELQDAIDRDIKQDLKPMQICKALNGPSYFSEIRNQMGLGSSRELEYNSVYKPVKPHMENKVMRHVLSELAVLRGDTTVQIETWIAYAKLKAKNESNIGGLLARIMLQAQRVHTNELYPEASLMFAQFLDQIGIGTAAPEVSVIPEFEATEWSSISMDGDIDLADEKAAKNARKSLLRDYTAVVHVFCERGRKNDPDFSLEGVSGLLQTLYDQGDTNGTQTLLGPLK